MNIKNIKDTLNYFFNWKKYPASVLFLAIPMFIMGMMFNGIYAYVKWQQDGDIIYALIIIGAVFLLGLGLWPIRKQLIQLLK